MLAGMTQAETNKENYGQCRNIADELEEIANGELYKCPECDALFSESDMKKIEDEDGEIKYICPECDEEMDEYELEQASFIDYLSDCLDITYYISGSRYDPEYRGARIMVTCGGPNIYIDTYRGTVELYWWGDNAAADIDRRTIEALDSELEELFSC